MAGITGSGTAGKLVRWLTGRTVGDSTIQDDGTAVGIGMAPNPSEALVRVQAPSGGEGVWASCDTGTALDGESSGTGTGVFGSSVAGSAGEFQQAGAVNTNSPALSVARFITGTADIPSDLFSLHEGSTTSGLTTGNLVNVQTATGSVFLILPDGTLIQAAPAVAPDDGFLVNGSISLYLDEGGGHLKAKIRLSNGTIKTATLAFDA